MTEAEKLAAAKLLEVPFYAADPGRVSGGNRTGQPAMTVDGTGMYPSAARTQLVKNPLYRPGGILPEMIPADLAAQLIMQMPK